jgi:hypothetical protein
MAHLKTEGSFINKRREWLQAPQSSQLLATITWHTLKTGVDADLCCDFNMPKTLL